MLSHIPIKMAFSYSISKPEHCYLITSILLAISSILFFLSCKFITQHDYSLDLPQKVHIKLQNNNSTIMLQTWLWKCLRTRLLHWMWPTLAQSSVPRWFSWAHQEWSFSMKLGVNFEHRHVWPQNRNQKEHENLFLFILYFAKFTTFFSNNY